jgi:hypothetical protein
MAKVRTVVQKLPEELVVYELKANQSVLQAMPTPAVTLALVAAAM